MADLATLKVKVDAADAVKQTKQLGDALKQTAMQGPLVSAAMGKTEAQIRQLARAEAAAYREAERMASSHKTLAQNMSTVATSVKGAAAAFAAFQSALAVRELVRFSDTAKILEGRIKLVTNNTAELAMVQESLFRTAQKVGIAYGDVVQLYSRVALNIKELGRSQQEVVKFTQLVTMAVQSSGASAEEAALATRQLSQALAGGVLRAEEYNSVVEQTPALVKAIADGLGLTIGQFRKLVVEGKAFSNDVFDAVLRVENKITGDLAKSPETVAKAWERSKNDILKSIGDLDKATGASGFFRFLARIPGTAAIALNPFYTPSAMGPQGREAQGAANLAQARAMTPEGRAESAAEAERKRIEAIRQAREAEVKAEAERYKAWQEEKKRSDERARWEMDEINRAQRLVDARLRVQSARAGFSMTTMPAMVSSLGGGPTGLGGGLGGMQGAALQQLGVTGQMQSVLKAQMAEYAKLQKDINNKALIDKAEAERLRNEQIAQNFAENMQRAFGDILTEFVTQGKVSVREIFNAMRSLGGSLIGQGISSGIQGLFGGTMTAMQSVLTGGALLGLGSLFSGGRPRAPRETYEQRMAKAQAQYASIELIRQQRADEMRKFVEGRTAGRGGVVQSVGTVLQETTASRMIGELVAIRVATTRTADAVSGSGSMAGTQVNVTVQGGMAGDAKAIGTNVAEAVDRLLGSRVQALRLTSGVAVTT